MIKLKNLTESLEKKYTLIESNQLNEKLSDNMPDWFAKRLLTTKYTPTSDYNFRDLGGRVHVGRKSTYLQNQGDKKNPKAGKEPTYRHTDFSSEDKSLFSTMLAKGISLDTVNIIEGPVPISDTDQRLQPPNIPIFLLDDGVVYAKGLNDDEKLGSRKTLGAYSIDSLLSKCIKFAYIDGNDPNNFQRYTRHDSRISSRKDSIYRADGPEKNRDGNSLGGKANRLDNTYDKSGYKIIPPMEKYKDKLAEIKAGKIYEIMAEYEAYLSDSQQELVNYISSLSFRDMSNNSGIIDTLKSRLEDAIDVFIEVEDQIDTIVNDSSKSKDDKKNNLVALINGDYPYRWGSIKQLNRKIDRFKDASKEVFNATIDWI